MYTALLLRPVPPQAGDADAALGMELQQRRGKQLRVMAHKSVPHGGHRAAHQLHAQLGADLPVIAQRLRPLPGVPLQHVRRDGGAVDQAQREKPRPGVLENSPDMVGVGMKI